MMRPVFLKTENVMNKEILIKGADSLNMQLSERQIQQFSEYSRLLVEWNEKMNLTAVTDPDGISVKHFLDSILPLSYIKIKENVSIADIGTGAGFPGIPIKIMREDTVLTLVDSLNKRINFLKTVSDEIGLENTECIHGRAEELARKSEFRDSFDVVVSRAVANMTVLCEYCLPFVKKGGMFVALKADNAMDEINSAKSMIGNLGGEIEEVISAALPMSDMTRTLVVVRKKDDTPKQFPRRSDKIKKSVK